MSEGTVSFSLVKYSGDWQEVGAQVIAEGSLTIFVNGSELATLMCTPHDPAQLALGFLANEELIRSISEVPVLYTCPGEGCVDIWSVPPQRIITSGCGGGLTFSNLLNDTAFAQQLASVPPVSISPERLAELARLMQFPDSLYARARGVHAAALSDGQQILIVAEDIGRHNTLDRLRGECLRRGMDSTGLILLTTGRISSEMLFKGAKMGCPLIASFSSPTSLSVNLARAWNITLCGYLRRKSLTVYAHPERLTDLSTGTAETASADK
jgi:FdhD protein